MSNVVYVTGNTNKARYFNQMSGLNIPHKKFDVDEIQSLDIKQIVEHKVRQAYELAECPVIVEDTRLVFTAFGNLPGTYIKWFLDEIGVEGLCQMLKSFEDRSAIAGAAIAYYDGSVLKIFEKSITGTISDTPKGDNGFGWNQLFIPEGAAQTLGEMNDEEFRTWYIKIKPFEELASFVNSRSA